MGHKLYKKWTQDKSSVTFGKFCEKTSEKNEVKHGYPHKKGFHLKSPCQLIAKFLTDYDFAANIFDFASKINVFAAIFGDEFYDFASNFAANVTVFAANED